jgi:hypothetical protein
MTLRHHCQPRWKLVAASRSRSGYELAPAITLNRMYHWVPSTISGDSQISGFRWKRTITTTNTGNSRFAGNAARNCASGWIFRPAPAAARSRRRPAPRSPRRCAISTMTRSSVISPSRTRDPLHRASHRCVHRSRRARRHTPSARSRGRPDDIADDATAVWRCGIAIAGERRQAHSAASRWRRSQPIRHEQAVNQRAGAAHRSSSQDSGALPELVCSKRNLSAQATSGRNSNWS